MGHQHDWWESLRRWFIPKLGLFTVLLEEITGKPYYVESRTREQELVGRVNMPVEEFEGFLHNHDYGRNPLASLKQRMQTFEVEEGSWRTIAGDDERKQIHVVLYDGNEMEYGDNDCTYVYAHYEYRWDTDPLKHYRGVDMNAKKGVLAVRNLLEENGVAVDYVQP